MKSFLKYMLVGMLCLSVTVPVCFSFLAYYKQLRAIKKEVKQELVAQTPKAALVSFNFNTNDQEFKDLYWHHSREFEQNGKMYDIVEADTLGSEVYYLCFPDKQETALNQKFKEALEKRYATDQNKENKTIQITTVFLSFYITNYTLELPSPCTMGLQAVKLAPSIYQNPILKLHSPPPWSLV